MTSPLSDPRAWHLATERNRLGRLVCNVEIARDLHPMTTLEELVATVGEDLETQIAYLQARLSSLGGPQLRALRVALDDEVDLQLFPAYTYGDSWNGFICALFTDATMEMVAAFLNAGLHREANVPHRFRVKRVFTLAHGHCWYDGHAHWYNTGNDEGEGGGPESDYYLHGTTHTVDGEAVVLYEMAGYCWDEISTEETAS